MASNDDLELEVDKKDSLKKLGRKSMQIDVTDLVLDKKLNVRSEKVRRNETLLTGFRNQVSKLEDALSNCTVNLKDYEHLDETVKHIMTPGVDPDLENPDHTRAIAYLKKHVSFVEIFSHWEYVRS